MADRSRITKETGEHAGKSPAQPGRTGPKVGRRGARRRVFPGFWASCRRDYRTQKTACPLKEQQDCSNSLSTSAPAQALVERTLNLVASPLRGKPGESEGRAMSRKTEASVASDCRLPSCLCLEKDGKRRFAATAPAKGGTPTVGAIVLMPDPRNILPNAESLIKTMFLRIGGHAYQVASFAQASQMFCIARDKNAEGASNTPSPLIVDDAGSAIAHVSYNGRVWPGDTWTVGAMPLYENRVV